MISWFGITAAGSFTVMAPAGAAISVWLALNRAWRLVLIWCLLFLGGMGLVVATKIAFVGWGLGIHAVDFTGFSGHAMRATSVAPVLLYLLLQKFTKTARLSGVLLGLAFGVLISYSRLEVHAHSVSEAVAGCLLGALIALGFIRILSKSSKINLNHWVIALSLVGLLSSPTIPAAPTQRWITLAALWLSGHERPYIRTTWRMAPEQLLRTP
ncbi:MAG: phosphatase PAP2 family protein [Sulfuriferula sp.]